MTRRPLPRLVERLLRAALRAALRGDKRAAREIYDWMIDTDPVLKHYAKKN